MFGPSPFADTSWQDDEACSVTSFEDVGPPRQSKNNSGPVVKDLVLRGTDDKPEDEVVPDILYVVQYRDSNGKLLNSM